MKTKLLALSALLSLGVLSSNITTSINISSVLNAQNVGKDITIDKPSSINAQWIGDSLTYENDLISKFNNVVKHLNNDSMNIEDKATGFGGKTLHDHLVMNNLDVSKNKFRVIQEQSQGGNTSYDEYDKYLNTMDPNSVLVVMTGGNYATSDYTQQNSNGNFSANFVNDNRVVYLDTKSLRDSLVNAGIDFNLLAQNDASKHPKELFQQITSQYLYNIVTNTKDGSKDNIYNLNNWDLIKKTIESFSTSENNNKNYLKFTPTQVNTNNQQQTQTNNNNQQQAPKSHFSGSKAILDQNGGWDKNNSGRWEWFIGNNQGLHTHSGWEQFKAGDSWTSLNDNKKHTLKGGWLYQLSDKSYATKQWLKVKGKWYWFDKNGYVNTHKGWEKCKHGWAYSLGTSGYYTNTTKYIGGHTYKFDTNAYAHKIK